MADVKVQVLKNGPLLVSGPVDFVDAEGKPIQPAKQPAALCRCGHSAAKPFCDGSHRKVNFQG
jgi:CDGSH-type Zn-finger protein